MWASGGKGFSGGNSLCKAAEQERTGSWRPGWWVWRGGEGEGRPQGQRDEAPHNPPSSASYRPGLSSERLDNFPEPTEPIGGGTWLDAPSLCCQSLLSLCYRETLLCSTGSLGADYPFSVSHPVGLCARHPQAEPSRGTFLEIWRLALHSLGAGPFWALACSPETWG